MDLHADADEVRDYCQHHPLSRPSVDWARAIVAIAAFEAVTSIIGSMLHLSASSFLVFEEMLHLLVLLLFGKPILRFLVKVYQRYASEQLRRQCTCKPTCSEYALLALQKYCWPKATKLIIKRVMVTCQQPGYKTDYP